ncbi:acyl-CoA dehydrogenase [Zavarzinia sp.]|uniref:acyl-CoA dehydrogenase n=1 Tax=Zavarzinia sp. TaxID=2027920 RepID=UPI00356304D3
MPILDRRDLDFLLHEVLDLDALFTRPRYADHDRAGVGAMLDTATAIADDHFASHAAKLDANEPTFDGTRVTIIPEVKAALDAYIEAGFMSAHADYDWGGMQLPHTVAMAASAIFSAANISTAGYPFLTRAAANVIAKFGSDEQKQRYLRPMLAGRFFGTMALTEPGAGSGLADLKTQAVPAEDGTYRITGNKIFISGGEHELSENIVHLVLARIKGAPLGVKGISLFVVPRILPDGARNDVRLAGLIHKMGYRGTTSTMLNFGEGGGAIGTLVGEPHKGLAYMFHMMNEARVGVGLGAAVLGYAGYRVALDYARTRLQGRPPQAKDPSLPPVPIIQHADVKRMLLASKAYVEGAMHLCLLGARLVDDSETAETPEARARAFQLLDLLTPVIKSWPSQYGLAANDIAIQVHGGYGYTREYPVERLYRDNRLNPIHEGTFGIQSLDLLGRKILADQGRALALLAEEMQAAIAAAPADLAEEATALGKAMGLVAETVAVLGKAAGGNRLDEALANSAVFLELMGHVVVAWLWLRQATIAARLAPAASGDMAAFYEGKRRACRYFFRWELPKIRAQAELLQSLDQTCAEMPDAAFG